MCDSKKNEGKGLKIVATCTCTLCNINILIFEYHKEIQNHMKAIMGSKKVIYGAD